jgi:hypothetical protein
MRSFEPLAPSHRWFLLPRLLVLVPLVTSACIGDPGDAEDTEPDVAEVVAELSAAQKLPRYAKIRDAARAQGIPNKAFLLAGIANDETGLAQCWSEATWACQGPSSPDCGGGAVIAGSADGPCGNQQGGLGMFQFDAGTYWDTLDLYGNEVLTVAGQVTSAIDYVTHMVKISAYTTNAETDAKARAWINNFDIDNAVLRDQWISTVVRYYNGCQPGWSCWGPRYKTYTDGLWLAVDEPGGLGFWASGSGTSCNGSPTTVGAIDVKYQQLGGCNSILGAPITEEQGAPDGVGRYSVFEHGSIYWTPEIGAYEVHGTIRDKWAELGWESGILGYPVSDETETPDAIGRYNVFEHGSIYWTPATGAHEVHGAIRDKWAEVGWESGVLGYPVSDEYAVSGGRRNDFEHGSITWNADTNQATVDFGSQPSSWKVLDVDYQVQQTSYWCGPAATRIALSARIGPPSQATLASDLGTTTNGTDWIGQITNELNDELGASRYATTEIPNDPPTQVQRDRLWGDIVLSIDNNYPVVANIVAPPSNHPPGYPNETIYHYFAVIGYNPDTSEVYIADSANFSGNSLYWLSFNQLATLIPPKGYAAYRCPSGLTVGAIDAKFSALGGCSSVVGGPVTQELATPDGVGRYNVFERGTIYWTPSTGAHEIHGRIRDQWADVGWEGGALGYPVSDEYAVAGGRRNDFEHGAIVWNSSNDQTTVITP